MGKIALIFLIGFFIFQFVNNFLYVDPLNSCFITILPSWDFSFNQGVVKKGMDVLKNASLSDYKNVCKRINIIDPNIDCGNSEGGCYYPGYTKKISVSTTDTTLNWVASVIVHETCHSKEDFEHRPLSEVECHHEDDRVLKLLTVYQ